MTYAEIKDLLSSGFTPEQITTLTTSAGPITADDSQDPAIHSQDPAPEPPAEGSGTDDAQSGPDPDAGTDSDGLQEIRKALEQLQQENKQLREMMQSNNIRDRTMDTPSVPEVSAEDILSGLIRPAYSGGEKK